MDTAAAHYFHAASISIGFRTMEMKKIYFKVQGAVLNNGYDDIWLTLLMEWKPTTYMSNCELWPTVLSSLMAGHWLWGRVVFLFIYPRKIAKFIAGTKKINYKEPQESFYNVLTYGFIDNFKTAITFNKRVKTKSLDILSLLILHY